jgi:hypothetical protein
MVEIMDVDQLRVEGARAFSRGERIAPYLVNQPEFAWWLAGYLAVQMIFTAADLGRAN